MAETGPATYDGFLSYSHAADDLLAPRLQAGLQRFAKPWWRRRALHIFRDEASLSANPHLWSSITDALDDSDWFVLLLSPQAAESEWVSRELDYWREHKDPHKILPVVTDGEFGWSDGDVAGDAVPESLRGVFADEPRWVDLRFARTETQLDLRHTRFRDAVADIAAAIRGVAKDELESEEIHQHRRTVRTAWTAGIAILALGVAATVGAVVTYNAQQEAQAQRDEAQRERDRAEEQAEIARANAEIARSRELAASAINVLDDDPELSVLLALEAAKGADPAFESVSALHEALYSHRTVHTIGWPEEWDVFPAPIGSISPGGRYVVMSGALNRMAMWDLESTADGPIWTFEVPYPDYAVISPQFTSEGSHVAATVAWFNLDEPAELWPEPPPEVGVYLLDTETGEVVQHFQGPKCPLITLFATGSYVDDSRLVGGVASSSDDCAMNLLAEVWLIDLSTGDMSLGYDQPVFTFHWGPPTALSADGRFLSLVDGTTSRVVEVSTGQPVFETEGGSQALVTQDGTRLLTGNDNWMKLWDINLGIELWNVDAPAILNTAYVNGDETRVFAPGHDGVVYVWDLATGRLLHELRGHSSPAWFLSMTADGTRLASAALDRTVKVWDLTAHAQGEVDGIDLPGVPVPRSGEIATGDRGAILAFPQGPDSRQPGTAVIFHPTTGLAEYLYPGYGGQMVRLSPDGSLLAGQPFVETGRLGPVHIRDTETGEVLTELEGFCTWNIEIGAPGSDCPEMPTAMSDVVWTIDFSHDGRMLAVGGAQIGIAGVWDVQSGRRITSLELATLAGNDGVNVKFSPTSEFLVASTTELHIFETAAWSQVASFPIGWGWWDLTFTPDGHHLLASDSPEGIILTLDTATWQSVGDPLEVAECAVQDFDISNDGSLIAGGCSDGFVRIWNTETGEQTQAIPLGNTTITMVQFLDGQHLLVAPQEKAALVMTIDIPELMDIARSRITRSFTDGECATYHIDPCPDLETIRGG